MKEQELFGLKGTEWKDGPVAGNGRIGVVNADNGNEAIYIFQNMDFIMPTGEPRYTPTEITGELHEARQAVINGDDSWDVNGRKRTYLYPFHPGEQLRLSFPGLHAEEKFDKTDYETNEIQTMLTCENEHWERKSFVSYADDFVCTCLEQSDKGTAVNVRISIDDLSRLPRFGKRKHGIGPETCMRYRKFADVERGIIGLIAHYPFFEASELAESGYLILTKVILQGGDIHMESTEEEETIRLGNNPVLSIENAVKVHLLTTTIKMNELGKLEDFNEVTGDGYIRIYEEELLTIADKYSDAQGSFSYEKALEASHAQKRKLFEKVSFTLSDTNDATLTNEEVLCKQKQSSVLLGEAVMRAYAQGRYALESSGAYSAPRLCGLWTGEFNPSWSGAYTMDANVNIQVSGMNVGNMYGAGVGYIYFILKQLKDWQENAKAVYGMENALLAPVNTDGSRAIMVEYDKDYPFQYWNAGASWLLVPIYEFWQCFGNRKIFLIEELQEKFHKPVAELEADILRPLLHMCMNFWCQLCTPEYYMDRNGEAKYRQGKKQLEEGEHYLILPSYSPENNPVGYNSTITANAAMDISAARDCMNMIIRLEEHIMDEQSHAIISRCRNLQEKLPEYLYDETGALCEWALDAYKDNNEHRHISHLYCAWPSYETQNDEDLRKTCLQAIQNREIANKGKDDSSSHGWIHRALVAARLKDGEAAAAILRLLFTSDIFYKSFMTDHDTDKHRGVYCTDTSIGLVGVIQEMLLYSDDDCIEFLPAIAPEWIKGTICGLRTRNRVVVEELTWDVSEKSLKAVLQVEEECQVRMICNCLGKTFCVQGKRIANGEKVLLEKGRVILEV